LRKAYKNDRKEDWETIIETKDSLSKETNEYISKFYQKVCEGLYSAKAYTDAIKLLNSKGENKDLIKDKFFVKIKYEAKEIQKYNHPNDKKALEDAID